MMNSRKLYPKWFLAPAAVVYTALFVIPCFMGFYVAMTNWNNFSTKIKFIGLANFRYIFLQDPGTYVNLLKNTVVFTILTTVFELIFGLGLALLINMDLRTRNILRTIFFMPFAISPIIIGIMFVALLKPEGLVNNTFDAIGLHVLSRQWLSDFSLAMPSVSLAEVWRYAGANMVIFLAGLQTIDTNYYEAADIDGAGSLQKFLHITLPYIMPAMTINLVLNTIHGMRVFEIIFALTNGGPGSATEVMNTAVFRAFAKGDRGLAAAISLLVFIITTVVSLLMNKLSSSKEVETA